MDIKIDYKIFSTILLSVILWLCVLGAIYYLFTQAELQTGITVLLLLLLFSLGFGIMNQDINKQ
jgi:hypothetical protein